MPVGWLTMGTPEDLQELLGRDPGAFEDEVDRRVTDAGGVTLDILWEEAGRPAHVIVAVPAKNADEVFALLEDVFETKATRLWNLHELKRRRSAS
jgi:hypothetical protein